MIEGLQVTLGAEELKVLCRKQAEAHAARAKQYEESLSTLESLDSPHKSSRPGDEAKETIARHLHQAAELEFIADHLDAKETYLLSDSDLRKLGVAYRGY